MRTISLFRSLVAAFSRRSISARVRTSLTVLDVAVYKEALAEEELSTTPEGLLERPVDRWASIIAEA
jgi:hypothetical protein